MIKTTDWAVFICLKPYFKYRVYLSSDAWLIWKTNPSEIERTYNIRKQQTRFYWLRSWELMEIATIPTPPSTGLTSILLSVSNRYSWRIRIWKISTLYRCKGRSFTNSTQKQWQLLHPLNNLEEQILQMFVFVCLIRFFTSQSTFFCYVRTGLLVLNKY